MNSTANLDIARCQREFGWELQDEAQAGTAGEAGTFREVAQMWGGSRQDRDTDLHRASPVSPSQLKASVQPKPNSSCCGAQ